MPVAVRSAGASGSMVARSIPNEPPITPHLPTTSATYRMLLHRGLAPDEAAQLTAFVWGIPNGTGRFQLRELNRLLFFRQLERAGRFGPRDGAAH